MISKRPGYHFSGKRLALPVQRGRIPTRRMKWNSDVSDTRQDGFNFCPYATMQDKVAEVMRKVGKHCRAIHVTHYVTAPAMYNAPLRASHAKPISSMSSAKPLTNRPWATGTMAPRPRVINTDVRAHRYAGVEYVGERTIYAATVSPRPRMMV